MTTPTSAWHIHTNSCPKLLKYFDIFSINKPSKNVVIFKAKKKESQFYWQIQKKIESFFCLCLHHKLFWMVNLCVCIYLRRWMDCFLFSYQIFFFISLSAASVSANISLVLFIASIFALLPTKNVAFITRHWLKRQSGFVYYKHITRADTLIAHESEMEADSMSNTLLIIGLSQKRLSKQKL